MSVWGFSTIHVVFHLYGHLSSSDLGGWGWLLFEVPLLFHATSPKQRDSRQWVYIWSITVVALTATYSFFLLFFSSSSSFFLITTHPLFFPDLCRRYLWSWYSCAVVGRMYSGLRGSYGSLQRKLARCTSWKISMMLNNEDMETSYFRCNFEVPRKHSPSCLLLRWLSAFHSYFLTICWATKHSVFAALTIHSQGRILATCWCPIMYGVYKFFLPGVLPLQIL